MTVAAFSAGRRTQIMVVDDSAVIRGLIARTLEAEADFEIVASVADGAAAVAAARRVKPQIIVLDVEMPVMDGLTAIPLLLAASPASKIIMASTLTARNAEVTLKALAAGASDYIPKPTATREMMGAASFNRELVAKVRQFEGARRAFVPAGAASPRFQPVTPISRPTVARGFSATPPRIIAIGSSTGGPQALFEVLKHLAPKPKLPIVITQHMPPTFTAILAGHITRQCGIETVEAKHGTRVEPGHAYVAPGDFHMLFERAGDVTTIRLAQDPPENFCRPSVDPMLRSLVKAYGSAILTVILTGMGQDGLAGSRAVVDAGGAVIAQDEQSSVVWGMPGAVANAGICAAILPLTRIGPQLRQMTGVGA